VSRQPSPPLEASFTVHKFIGSNRIKIIGFVSTGQNMRRQDIPGQDQSEPKRLEARKPVANNVEFAREGQRKR